MKYKEKLDAYLDDLVPGRAVEFLEMEDYANRHNFPIIGPASGQFCYTLTRMTGAKRVFELGSGFGYSTAWFALGVQENGGGEVHHTVWEETLSRMARKHLTAMGFDSIVHYHVAEAVYALRQVQGQFDLIFNDIDKQTYPESLAVIESKLKPGGVLIVDNMIWGGRVFDAEDKSADTTGIRELTRLLTRSANWSATLVPIRDGLMVAYRRV